MTDKVQIEMTEEEAVRYFAAKMGLCLIDWETVSHMVARMPEGMLVYDAEKRTYRLAP